MSPQTADHLPTYRVRPRFKLETGLASDQLIEQLQSALDRENAECQGSIHALGGTLSLPPQQQHYWSPQLSLSFEETETGTILRGLYGPRPAIWSMFVFFYAIIGVAALIAGIVGMSMLSLGKSSALLWVVPVLLLLFLTLYLVSYSGQKVGRKQMIILHQFLEESTGLTIDET